MNIYVCDEKQFVMQWIRIYEGRIKFCGIVKCELSVFLICLIGIVYLLVDTFQGGQYDTLQQMLKSQCWIHFALKQFLSHGNIC